MEHNQALVLIDLQIDYFPGGGLPLPRANQALAAAVKLLAGFRARRAPVFHIRQHSVHPGAAFLVAGSEGTRAHPGVAAAFDERIIDKHLPNAFVETSLERELRGAGIARLVFAGMMTNMCVDATVRQAKDLGFSCILVEEACAACELDWQSRKVPADEVHAAFAASLAMGYAALVAADDLV